VNDTIFALSSGTPPAAIAVVRISGPGADPALLALGAPLPEPRRATLVTLRAEDEVLDRALALRFPGPNSATGEDVVELHLHGGRAVLAAVQEALSAVDGLRPAEPGEFTRRAFENGRIDLAEAEGLADLLEAETEAQRRAALSLAGGALSRQVEAWQARLLGTAALVEAELDFDDEGDVQAAETDRPRTEIAALAAEIDDWLARPGAERLKDGIRVVIAGPPNAGKSSLLNVLAGRDAAITSALPGTTRDSIEAPVAFGGVPFLLIDTAGLRETADEIEILGIDRARRHVEAADIVLWLGDPADRPHRAVQVRSRRDLDGQDPSADFSVSAVTGEGIDDLSRMLVRHSNAYLPVPGEVALNRRHSDALRSARGALAEAQGSGDLLVVAEALRGARAALDRVTGRAGVEDMLDALFGRFCIGK
jgi:tRNA modification GTPase